MSLATTAALLAAVLARDGMQGPHLPFEGKSGWCDHVARTRFKLETWGGVNATYKLLDTQWGLMMYFYAAPPLVGGDKSKAQQIGEQLATAVPDLGRYYQGRLAAEMKDLHETLVKKLQTDGLKDWVFRCDVRLPKTVVCSLTILFTPITIR